MYFVKLLDAENVVRCRPPALLTSVSKASNESLFRSGMEDDAESDHVMFPGVSFRSYLGKRPGFGKADCTLPRRRYA